VYSGQLHSSQSLLTAGYTSASQSGLQIKLLLSKAG